MKDTGRSSPPDRRTDGRGIEQIELIAARSNHVRKELHQVPAGEPGAAGYERGPHISPSTRGKVSLRSARYCLANENTKRGFVLT